MTDWNSETVAMRLQEAAKTAHRLPPVKVMGYFNLWPPFVRTGIEGFAQDESPPRFPPSPREVERMLEVIGWMNWLEVEQRKLLWMRAERYRWDEIAHRFGYSPRTAQRHWRVAIFTLVCHLQGELPEVAGR